MFHQLKEQILFTLKKKIYPRLSLTNQRRIWNIRNGWRHRHTLHLLKANKRFRNCHKGKRCFILGNGPSLKSLDFSLLENEITFTVNQLPRNPNFAKLKTNYHFFSDPYFFTLKEHCPEEMEVLEIIKQVNAKNNHPTVFWKLAGYDFVKHYDLDKILNISYYDEYFLTHPAKQLKSFIDFTHLVPQFFTVVHYAVAMAVYMGFKEIYLLGCDCSGFISTAQAKLKQADCALYGYNITDNEKKRMEKQVSQIPMWLELHNYVELFEYYDYLFRYCKKNDVKLYNATQGGLLESVPRVSLSDVLSKEVSYE